MSEASQIPVDNLAYIGDAVYELFIREEVMKNSNLRAGKLHRLAVHFARAKFQANAAVNIAPYLTPIEENILRRGRNANQGSMAKHASPQEYRLATGLEALIGYLYLSGQKERLDEILQKILIEGERDAKE